MRRMGVHAQTAEARAAQQHLADEREQRQAERFTKVQRQRDAARQQAQDARETAARLQGQVEPLNAHAIELTAPLKSFGAEAPSSPAHAGAPTRDKAGG